MKQQMSKADCESRPVTAICENCGGEGRLFESRYGGNDPDVWDVGPCPACEGTGYADHESEPVTLEDIERIPPEEHLK